MAAPHRTPFAHHVNPNNPATWLKPGESLMAGGFDWAWCYAWFKPVPDHPDYCVGSDGSVWSQSPSGRGSHLGGWRRIYGSPVKGYRLISLSGSPRSRTFRVHHLVLAAFVCTRPPGLQCRHLDGNPANNRLDNLRWGTQLENSADSIRHGTQIRGSRCPRAVLTEPDVVEIRRLAASGVFYKDIAPRYGVPRQVVSDIMMGKLWAHVEVTADVAGCMGVNRSLGSSARNAKLTEQDIRDIRTLIRQGLTHDRIGERFGVAGNTITHIASGQRWGHVDPCNGVARVVRGPIREEHPNAKLGVEQVREILTLISQKHTARSIAQRFGVSKKTIGAIKRGLTWKHVIRE